jgi:hypothetical protein
MVGKKVICRHPVGRGGVAHPLANCAYGGVEHGVRIGQAERLLAEIFAYTARIGRIAERHQRRVTGFERNKIMTHDPGDRAVIGTGNIALDVIRPVDGWGCIGHIDLLCSVKEPIVVDPESVLAEVGCKPKSFSHPHLDSVSPETRMGPIGTLERGVPSQLIHSQERSYTWHFVRSTTASGSFRPAYDDIESIL